MIGFCCKWLDHESQINGIGNKEAARALSTWGTTVAWLNRQTVDVAEQRLWDMMEFNIESIRLLVERVGALKPEKRMVRLGSDLLGVYTEAHWRYFYQRSDVQDYCAKHFRVVGDLARKLGVRLSFHPGHFTVLSSGDPDIIRRSVEEFEYHCDMIRWMGYGVEFQDFKCNIHISGPLGAQGVIDALKIMSPEARNSLTIENGEIGWGIDESLKLVDHCALVIDVHHHWVRTGEYLEPDDARVRRVMDSWRGVRPVIHYSQPRKELLVDHDPDVQPDMDALLAQGFSRVKFRAHSDFYWNQANNRWVSRFLPEFDVQTESKAKNLARDFLVEDLKSFNLITV